MEIIWSTNLQDYWNIRGVRNEKSMVDCLESHWLWELFWMIVNLNHTVGMCTHLLEVEVVLEGVKAIESDLGWNYFTRCRFWCFEGCLSSLRMGSFLDLYRGYSFCKWQYYILCFCLFFPLQDNKVARNFTTLASSQGYYAGSRKRLFLLVFFFSLKAIILF